jgi:hypothetical protein
MKADHLRPLAFLKMAGYRFTNIATQFVESISLRENADSESASRVASLGRVLNHEN